MTAKRRIAKRWKPEEIDRFAIEPDIAKADALAREIGGAVLYLWEAQKDNAEPERPENPPASELGQ